MISSLASLSAWQIYIESLHPAIIDLSLERVRPVAERLQLTHFPCPVIMVTGTNGKGSLIAALDTLYQGAGYRVGRYLSPHLFCLTEQVTVAGKELSESMWMTAFQQVELARNHIPLTTFEFISLAALLLLQQQAPEVVLLEMGMGAKDDVMNIVEPTLSIITTIALDHTEWLGSTRDAIGFNKAHIFRPNKKAICADPNPPASVIDYAAKLNAELFCYGQDFYIHKTDNEWQWWYRGNRYYNNLPHGHLDITAWATGIMAAQMLKTVLPVTDAEIKASILYARLPGRFEEREINGIWHVFDVAHNPEACRNLARKLRERYPGKKLHAVVSFLKDKDIAQCLAYFKEIIQEFHTAPLAVARAAPRAQLMAAFAQNNIQTVKCYNTITEAYALLTDMAQFTEGIVIFGSFVTVAACLHWLDKKCNSSVV